MTEEQRKQWRTVQAELTLAGFVANLIDDDRGVPVLIVSRGALTRELGSPEEARAWLARVTGRAVQA